MYSMRRTLRAAGPKFAAGLATASVCALLVVEVFFPAIGNWLEIPKPQYLVLAEAIIVHGGNPSRTAYHITLFRHGLAFELWHTGYAKGEATVTICPLAEIGADLI